MIKEIIGPDKNLSSRYLFAMKILIDGRMAYPPTHGIARYTTNLIRGLNNKVALDLIVSGKKSENFFRQEAPWISNFVHAAVPFANPLASVELSLRIPRRYDLVHFTSFSVPIKMPRRSVITIHDLIHLKEGASLAHRIYYNTIVKRGLQKCSRVIAVSKWTKNDIVDCLKVPTDKIDVIPNGLEQGWFASTPIIPTENKFREARQLRLPYVCCVANPKRHKNLQTLLSACEILWNESKSFELALAIGSESLPKDLKINPLYLPRIKLLQKLTEPELMALYRHALATILPSQYEGYGFPVAESLAMGTQVILSQTSALQEFSGEGVNFYSPFDSAGELAKAIGQTLSGKENINQVPPQVIDQNELGKKTLEVYHHALMKA